MRLLENPNMDQAPNGGGAFKVTPVADAAPGPYRWGPGDRIIVRKR